MSCAMRHGLACRPARGQALLETLLVAMLAVPLLLGTLFLFELQAAQQAALAAARQALFQHHYARGTISVLSRAGLEAASCTCYGTVEADYQRLFN